MIKSAPYFNLYPERWLAGTAHMSDAEQLSYFKLICHQWLMGGLEDDIKTLKRLAGKGVTEKVLEKFPACPDGMRRNARLEAVREEQKSNIQSRKIGAALSHMKRYGVTSLSDDERSLLIEAGKLDPALLSKPSASLQQGAEDLVSTLPPSTIHHPPVIERENAGENSPGVALVESIVQAYPRQDAPMDCRQYVSICIASGDDPKAMLEAVQKCAALIRAAPNGSGNAFVTTAKRFFAEEQWRSPEKFEKLSQPRHAHQPSHQPTQGAAGANKPGRYS